MGLLVTNDSLDRYFKYLKALDNDSKKRLIIKLTESMQLDSKGYDFSGVFGDWDDPRSSDEIIDEIIASRIDKTDLESLE